MIAHILTATSITVVADFRPHVVGKDHLNFHAIKALCADITKTEADVLPLLDVPKAVQDYTDGAVYVKNGALFHNGAEVRTSLGKKILEFIRSGQDGFAASLKALLANVSQNPDPRVQTDLWDWLQAAELPVTGDGYVLAWKAVTKDYRSLHAPNDTRFDHRIGKRVWQPRDECDADPNKTCSRGLHFAAASYLENYAAGGSRIVVVKIHPKDIVAFPTDYHLKKGRACDYTIVGEVPHDKVKDYYPQGVPVYTGFDAPKPAAKPSKPFLGEAVSLGQVYRRRDGRCVVIVSIDTGLKIAEDHNGFAYDLRSGSEYGDNRVARSTDLIKKIDFDLTADDFEVGQRWVQRNGEVVTIETVTGDGLADLVHTTGGVVYRETGTVWRDRRPADTNLVFRLDYAPVQPKAERLNGFAVGQVWKTRAGMLVTISQIAKTGTYPVHTGNGATYSVGGLYFLDRTSSADLVTLVTDVH